MIQHQSLTSLSFMLLLFAVSCSPVKGQSDITRELPPYSKGVLESHRIRANLDDNYFVLACATEQCEEFLFININWLNASPADPVTIGNVDSVLNTGFGLAAIDAGIDLSIDRSKMSNLTGQMLCALADRVFDNEGYYDCPSYLINPIQIISLLVASGAHISEGGYDGAIFLDRSTLDCN